jgi:phage anti-repressor protein
MANNIIAFSQDLAQQLFDSEQVFVVDFDLAWVWLGYTRKSSAKRKLELNFVKDTDYCTKWCNVSHSNTSSASRVEQIMLTIDCFKSFGMMAGTEQGRQVRSYFLNCEKVAKNGYPRQVTGPVFATPTEELMHKATVAINMIFPEVAPELRQGMIIEGVCNVDPSLRPILEPHKPKLLLDAPLLSPKTLGELMSPPISAIAMNKLLCDRGFQEKTGEKNPAYRLIGQGHEFGKVVADTAMGHGKTVQHVRWYESVLSAI